MTGKKDATITKVDGVMDVDEADKKDGAEAVSDAEKDAAAHKLAAEGVARAEAAKRLVEEEQRKQAAKDAENKTNKKTRRMGALQVRGSKEDAEEIYWMLSEGEDPAAWRKVLYNDTTDQQSHRTEFRGWLATKAVSVAFWAAARNGWVRYGDACYRINALGGDRLVEQTTSQKQGATWSRPTTTAWAPDQESYVWGPNGIHCTTGTPRRTYAEATGGDKESLDVAGVLKAFQQEFRAEVKKDMQEAIAKALAAQAAESPAASAAPRGGRASAQDPEAQLKQLQQKVTELEVAKEKLQQKYFESFAGKVAAEYKVQQLEGTVTELTDRIKALESPFHTPVRPSSAAAPQGEAPQPAAMPVPEGEMFSKGVSGGRRAGRQEARRMWIPPGGQGTNLVFPPGVAGAPFIFNSALPVRGVVPVHPKEAGPESPGKEEAKEQEVRKEEEGGQPAVAAAPAAAAAPAGAAVCPQGREGTGSKVRLPDRQPGESGVTPDAKVTRSAEPAGAASSEEEAGGLAPMRLNSNFSAAAGQAEMSDQNR